MKPSKSRVKAIIHHILQFFVYMTNNKGSALDAARGRSGAAETQARVLGVQTAGRLG